MQGIKRHTKRMGYGTSPLPTPDPEAREDTCLLCGHYLPLSKDGHCNLDPCLDAARKEIRRRADGRKMVPGMYYLIGTQEIFQFACLEKWREPVPPSEYQDHDTPVKPADCCEYGQCEFIARPNDSLCVSHRREATVAIRRAQPKATRRRFDRVKPKTTKRVLTHKIKGLDSL